MKRKLIFIGMYLPWVTVTALLAWFSLQEYAGGRDFARALHPFRWMVHVYNITVAWLTCSLICVIVVIKAGKAPYKKPLLVILASLIIPVIAFFTLQKAFDSGRNAAYAAIDCHEIFEAAMELREQIAGSSSDFYLGQDDCVLPPTIRRMQPMAVYANENVVAIQMDGGGPAGSCGLAIVFDPEYVQEFGMWPLHDSLPVYRFALYGTGVALKRHRKD